MLHLLGDRPKLKALDLLQAFEGAADSRLDSAFMTLLWFGDAYICVLANSLHHGDAAE